MKKPEKKNKQNLKLNSWAKLENQTVEENLRKSEKWDTREARNRSQT